VEEYMKTEEYARKKAADLAEEEFCKGEFKAEYFT
jgi:hypothetical protein